MTKKKKRLTEEEIVAEVKRCDKLIEDWLKNNKPSVEYKDTKLQSHYSSGRLGISIIEY